MRCWVAQPLLELRLVWVMPPLLPLPRSILNPAAIVSMSGPAELWAHRPLCVWADT
jgi:hypothetical protein